MLMDIVHRRSEDGSILHYWEACQMGQVRGVSDTFCRHRVLIHLLQGWHSLIHAVLGETVMWC